MSLLDSQDSEQAARMSQLCEAGYERLGQGIPALRSPHLVALIDNLPTAGAQFPSQLHLRPVPATCDDRQRAL